MKEAIRDCPAISYFDRYPVIRFFRCGEGPASRGQKTRVKEEEEEEEGGKGVKVEGGESKREKKI